MATAKIVLRKKLNNGEYRIAIRLAHLKEPSQYINLPFRCYPEQWLKGEQRIKKNKVGFNGLNTTLIEIEENIEIILIDLLRTNSYSFEAFKSAYYNESDNRTVKQVFNDKLVELNNVNRIGSYVTYKACLTSLEKYKSLDIDFSTIDYKFLKGFEQYHLKLGNKLNTIGNYLRSLRALHYEFCKINNLQEPGIYKRFNIARFKNETTKRSLSKKQLRDLIEYVPQTNPQIKAKYVFLFSFYCRGINLMDMLQLTDENISNNIITYTRSKTRKQIRIRMTPEAIAILKFFKNDTKYLFPYLRPNDITKYRVMNVNRYVNEQLELIGKSIKLKTHITFYSARHTFAELHYKAGIRIEIISQMLGHSDLKTTQTYLRSFSDDEVDNAASKVFDTLL